MSHHLCDQMHMVGGHVASPHSKRYIVDRKLRHMRWNCNARDATKPKCGRKSPHTGEFSESIFPQALALAEPRGCAGVHHDFLARVLSISLSSTQLIITHQTYDDETQCQKLVLTLARINSSCPRYSLSLILVGVAGRKAGLFGFLIASVNAHGPYGKSHN